MKQSLCVCFPICIDRQFFQANHTFGNHIIHQFQAKLLFNGFKIYGVIFRNDKGNQHVFTMTIIFQNNFRIIDFWQMQKSLFNFIQFDTKSAQLNLAIHSSAKNKPFRIRIIYVIACSIYPFLKYVMKHKFLFR
ncbi:hypothetical protein D1872_189210 [compost metagenome]